MRALLVSSLVGLVLAPAALAHQPVFGGEGRLLDAETSYARYAALERDAARQTYRVRVGEEGRLLVELLIPDRAPENRLATASLPRVAVLGGDARRWTPPRIRVPFEEGLTRTSYLRIGRRSITGLPAGIYEVVVTGAASSRFVLVTGTQERFGARDVARLPFTIAKVQTWYREGPTEPPGRIGTAFWLIPVIAGLVLASVVSAIGLLVATVVHRVRRRAPRAKVGSPIR